jgi:hypothetical protein
LTAPATVIPAPARTAKSWAEPSTGGTREALLCGRKPANATTVDKIKRLLFILNVPFSCGAVSVTASTFAQLLQLQVFIYFLFTSRIFDSVSSYM